MKIVTQYLRGLIPAHKRIERCYRTFLESGEREIHLLGEYVAAGDVAIDAGANLGSYTLKLAELVGPSGRVVAVEPVPELGKMLKTAVPRLGLPIDVLGCALSDKEGEAELTIPIENGIYRNALSSLNAAGAGRRFTVKTRTLDGVRRDIGRRVAFVKIDVEGHELPVLRGGESFLRADRPTLMIEIEQRHSPTPIAQTFEFLHSLGYRGSFFDVSRARRDLSEFDAAQHQRVERAGEHDYVNDFFFTPIELSLSNAKRSVA